MTGVVPYLGALFCGLSLLSMVFAWVLFRADREPAFGRLAALWAATSLSTALLGVTIGDPLLVIFGYGSVGANAVLLVRVLQLLGPLPLRLKETLAGLALGIGSSLAAWTVDAPFAIVMLPTAMAVSWPIFRAVVTLSRHWGELTPAGRMLVVVTGVLVAHCMDFPFVADKPALAPWGLTFGIACAFALGLLSLSAVIEQVGREREEALASYNRHLEQFALATSHDLKEPVRQVVSYSGLIAERSEGLDETTRRWLGYVTDGGRRAEALLGAMMDYLRVDVAPGAREPVDCDALIEEVTREYAPLLDETHGRIVRAPLPVVEGDPGQLRQLFGNLVQNALKYRTDRPPEVRITGETEREGVVHFTVADNGIGIPGDQRDRVFDLFKRGAGSKEYPGTGLGLAICRRVVERHGGRIWIDGADGEGSRVHFTLASRELRR